MQVAGPFPAHHGDYGHSTKPLQHEVCYNLALDYCIRGIAISAWLCFVTQNSEEAWVIVDSQEIQHPIQRYFIAEIIFDKFH